MGIGSLSIIAGIITTISQFLQVSELNEGYRSAAVSWNKLYNNLKTLIARHPLDRISPNEALKIYKDQYEHLVETSPPILKKVISQFNTKFKKKSDLDKPEICNKLDSTDIFNISPQERQAIINKINNIKKIFKLLETFYNINGRNASEDEIEMLQNNVHIEDTNDTNDINDTNDTNDNTDNLEDTDNTET